MTSKNRLVRWKPDFWIDESGIPHDIVQLTTFMPLRNADEIIQAYIESQALMYHIVNSGNACWERFLDAGVTLERWGQELYKLDAKYQERSRRFRDGTGH